MHVYKELKCGVGFEDYLKHVKGPFLGCFLSFVQLPMDLFKELGRYAKRAGSQACPNIGACMKSVKHVLFECASLWFPEAKFFRLYEANPYSESGRSFQSQQHFDKAMFCLGEKQGMLVNDGYSSWYNKVGDF